MVNVMIPVKGVYCLVLKNITTFNIPNQLPSLIAWLTRRIVSLSGFHQVIHSHFITLWLIELEHTLTVQLKYENRLLNATIFNVETVAHEDTCDCLQARNLFETPDKQVRKATELMTDEDDTETSMKNATRSEGRVWIFRGLSFFWATNLPIQT